jgi:hypothetical protein
MERDWSSVRGRKIIMNKVKRYSWSNSEITILTNIQKIVSKEISEIDYLNDSIANCQQCTKDDSSCRLNVFWITS